MKNKKVLIIGGVVVVIVLIIAAVVAVIIIKNNQNTENQNSDQISNNAFGGNRFLSDNIAVIQGKVSSIEDKTLIVDTTDGNGERVVNISDNTSVLKTDTITKDQALVQGKNIIVTGDKQGTTITAQSILVTIAIIRNGSSSSNSNGNSSSQQSSQSSRTGFGGRGLGGGAFQQNLGANATFGMIDSINGDTVTIKDQRANTEYTVNIQASTVFKMQSRGAITDLKSDQTVNVIGTKDTSGTITARNINIQ